MPKALVLGGGTGLLGKALMNALADAGWAATPLGRQDGDIMDPDFMRDVIEHAKPDAVFNAIAWTQVDAAEDNPEGAMSLNRALPDTLARILSAHKSSWLVHFSTDFVFSGSGTTPRKESDEPAPQSVYGQTKLEGEKAVLRVLPDRSCIIRTAWLFGPGKGNFIETILNACQKRESINVVDDQFGSPTYTPDLAEWSVALAARRANGIWHGVNSGRSTWCELASEAVQLAQASCRVLPITSAEWPQKARRPAYSVLDNSKLSEFLGQKPRPWQKAVRDYIFSSYQAMQKEARP